MTAAYMTRCVYLTFFGEYRGGETLAHPPDEGAVAHDVHAPGGAPTRPAHGAPYAHGEHDAHDARTAATTPTAVMAVCPTSRDLASRSR